MDGDRVARPPPAGPETPAAQAPIASARRRPWACGPAVPTRARARAPHPARATRLPRAPSDRGAAGRRPRRGSPSSERHRLVADLDLGAGFRAHSPQGLLERVALRRRAHDPEPALGPEDPIRTAPLGPGPVVEEVDHPVLRRRLRLDRSRTQLE